MILSRTCLILGLLYANAAAQLLHPAPKLPSFSVVSIRPSNPAEDQAHGTITPDTYRAEHITLRELIAYAFGLGYEQELVGAPSWVLNDRFDVQAKLDEDQLADFGKRNRDGREEQMRLMMQSVLAERLHLTYHFSTRSLSVFELQLTKGGLKCPQDTTSPPAIADPALPRFRWYNPPAPPPPARDSSPPSAAPALNLRTRGWPFWLLVSWIGHQPELDGRPLIDKTGLNSSYDCQMSWSHDVSDEAKESLFSALQSQLGLRIQAARNPIEVLVIDSIQKPSANSHCQIGLMSRRRFNLSRQHGPGSASHLRSRIESPTWNSSTCRRCITEPPRSILESASTMSSQQPYHRPYFGRNVCAVSGEMLL